MDELFLYDKEKGLFKEILKKSKVMQGRYHVSPNYGHDLNTNNLDSFLKDEKYGLIAPKQKTPLVVCMPPQSFISNEDGNLGEEYFFELFFLCNTGFTGTNQVKSVDSATQRSTHHIWYDWKDMKEVAVEFIEAIRKVSKRNRLKQYFGMDLSRVPVRRISRFNNDVLSGVSITLRIDMNAAICSGLDYDDEAISSIEIPPTTIHPLHKH